MSKRSKKLKGSIGSFIKAYQRKAYPHHDPNDRSYDRELEAIIKKMDPEELSELMSGDLDEIDSEIEIAWDEGKKVPGLKFQKGDLVKVISGKHASQEGHIDLLLALKPNVIYVIELKNGNSINVVESVLQPLTGVRE